MPEVRPSNIDRILAYLDAKGAAFKSIEGYPGWFSAHWEDYDDYSYPQRWACSTEEGEADRPFALAFQKRAELSGLVETLH